MLQMRSARMRMAILAAILLLIGLIYMNMQTTTPLANNQEHGAHEKNADGSWQYTNKLIDQTSPYLLQHAHNPVDWYPWGPEAFDVARRQNKPIFLSIGYSSCYWCHVMERLVFTNPAIAAQMNEHFVNIKVDREERPDIDDIYMTATQIFTHRGGWPMSVFLTPPGAKGADDPGLKPFFAGTYFPPQPQRGMPSFPQILERMADAWQRQRKDVLKQADTLTSNVIAVLSQRDVPAPVDSAIVNAAIDQLLFRYDQTHGGFGDAPKFPQPINLQLLLASYRNDNNQNTWQAISHTLDRMARGGMYDQVGGGFHRYATDEQWRVPHFEKMLYDNGQLVELYALAFTQGDDQIAKQQYARIIRETCDYVLREMTDPQLGAFFSSQDAEVDAREGGSYIWTDQQIRQVMTHTTLAELAFKMYGLDGGPNFSDPHHPQAEPANVLYLPMSLDQLASDQSVSLEELLQSRKQINTLLKAARDKRKQPTTDKKVITAWNGLMIAGLAEAAIALDEPRYSAAAARGADAITKHMSSADGGLYRTMRQSQAKIPAFLEDYAFFIHALLALHRADDAQDQYLDQAERLVRYVIDHFATPQGGYYDSKADQEKLFVRKRGFYDGAIASGNSQMIHNQVDLYQLTGDLGYLHRAADDLRSFATVMQQNPTASVHMQHALLRTLNAATAQVAEQLQGASTGTH